MEPNDLVWNICGTTPLLSQEARADQFRAGQLTTKHITVHHYSQAPPLHQSHYVVMTRGTQVSHFFCVRQMNNANPNTERPAVPCVQVYQVTYNLSATGWSLILCGILTHLFAVSTVIFSLVFSPHSHVFQGLHQSRLAGTAQAGGPSMATLTVTCPRYRKWISGLSSQAVVVT